ncbi:MULTISPECIES: methanol/ethanol family PQQ-dependent dehydrogenase [Mesorhizobium]|uniref:methanol/ethanol family PQQ-dependent dehydrogenase n=1 Tax=Mesorhizobium TaxID=68287 RepID=UPI0007A93DD7|nr:MULTISPECIES: methanol/ethanol family PQQ-dependent dehydrogenase [Mesorhizobium]AMX97898.1 methanol dehydrogenase [Mesorhizobium ciceri]MDF3233824.1 methanol/ethanol family PQQ-dependent dehydrogenase [Mesorhizobium sp. DSM 30133]RUU15872.1 PQQ-dependent dehydrogenase, methanol/ethanol family [Mesorhizobium sp. Primo-B]RUU34538.1 PQQ-dependent dehydrogenase, methanol/ethanol family [Mesorhizobium sp. Primo-A]RVB89980.1 PQQ-dependent dehydrogenase, methanol/ethanol family [Mesorhizobium sp.
MKGMLHPAPARVDAGHGARALATENSFRTGILSVMLLACGLFLSGASEPASAAAIAPPAAAAPPDDGQWTMPAKNYASTRFSELSEINEGNVKNLQVAFTFSTGVNKGQEAAPLVVGNNMYIVTPFPNIVYALDLSRPGAPMKWKYEPNPEPAAQGVACCDVVNRGAAFADGRIFFNTLDGHTIALDANTGKPIWNTHIGNINIGETITMAPLVVKGKVLVGNSGGEMGVRGWVKALDAGDGHVVWTAYGTGPDKDVLIGPDFKPHYDMDRGTDLGVTTWPPEAWKIGGGNMWGWISYDPELNLIFHGTGNPGPWNPDLRPGDNKWTSGIFARDADTGAAKWFYQWSPHDLHDYDGINEQILLDMTWQGKPRKVLVRPERNGYLYILDRTTGEVLSATAYGPVNSSKGVDLKTGRLIANPDKRTGTGKVVRDICPTASGLKDWQPSAFSPRTGLLYIPHNNLCMDEEGVEVNYIAGTPYVGMNVRMIPGPGGNRGAFTAWDVSAAKPAWVLKENFPVWSGTVVTAGDVVFYGTMEGWFKAVSARTGDLLWQFKTSSGIIGQPITYRGPDGHQYVAILAGVGGWAGAIVSGDLDPRDATAALGFVNAMKDLKNATTAGGTLYVFRLP